MSNKTTTIRVNSCPDSTVTLNGNPFLSVASGGSVASELVNSENTQITPSITGAKMTLPDTNYDIFVAGSLTPISFSLPTLKNETINIVWQ
jgi:hypothetical protein